MYTIIFKNLEPSILAEEVVLSRVSETLRRFPKMNQGPIRITLSMENSPQQAGPDVFGVRLQLRDESGRDIILEKKTHNLYLAVAELCEALIERLSRAKDRIRVLKRRPARKMRTLQQEKTIEEDEESE